MFTDTILRDDHPSGIVIENTSKCIDNHESSTNENLGRNSFVWTADSINLLLKLYESKLGLLTTPKKKTRIWMAISDDLRDYSIEVSPDQVRWKINALTRRYNQCIDSGHHKKFKYFTELYNIYAQSNINCYKKSKLITKKNYPQEDLNQSEYYGIKVESKSRIELRKHRLADKIESDICQSKVQLEKQWLEYLKNQEEQRLLKDEIFERKLKLRQEHIDLRKRKLDLELLELRNMQCMEKEQDKIIKLENEKCKILHKLFKYNI